MRSDWLSSITDISVILSSGISIISIAVTLYLAKCLRESNRELELLKNDLEKQSHISKLRFDYEFNRYAKLSKDCYKCYRDTYWLYPLGIDTNMPSDTEKKEKELERRLVAACNSGYSFEAEINKSRVFINEDILNECISFLKMCSEQKEHFIESYLDLNGFGSTKNIHNAYVSITDDIRDYLKKDIYNNSFNS